MVVQSSSEICFQKFKTSSDYKKSTISNKLIMIEEFIKKLPFSCDLKIEIQLETDQLESSYKADRSFMRKLKKNFLHEERKIDRSLMRIRNCIFPSPVFPFPEPIIQEILKYLNAKELFLFSRLNHQGKRFSEEELLLRAKGYDGKIKSVDEARQYFKEFFTELKILSSDKWFLKYFKNLNNNEMQLNEILDLRKDFALYKITNFPKIHFFLEQKIHLFTQSLSSELESTKWPEILISHVKLGHWSTVKFLLNNKIDPNFQVQKENGMAPLHYAVDRGDINIMRLLLGGGAVVNQQNFEGNTPLHLACAKEYCFPLSNSEIIELLLNYGADPNISNHNHALPLDLALQSRLKEVEFFLKNSTSS